MILLMISPFLPCRAGQDAHPFSDRLWVVEAVPLLLQGGHWWLHHLHHGCGLQLSERVPGLHGQTGYHSSHGQMLHNTSSGSRHVNGGCTRWTCWYWQDRWAEILFIYLPHTPIKLIELFASTWITFYELLPANSVIRFRPTFILGDETFTRNVNRVNSSWLKKSWHRQTECCCLSCLHSFMGGVGGVISWMGW